MKKSIFLLLTVLILFVSCQSSKNILRYDPSIYPDPVDTHDRAIKMQRKTVFRFPSGVQFDNKFDGARMNDVRAVDDSTYLIYITPENEPINYSPYYAFRLWTEADKDIAVQLTYPSRYHHRYIPKLSQDGKTWAPIDSSHYKVAADTGSALLKLHLSAGKVLYVAAQELKTSKMTEQWVHEKEKHPLVHTQTIGKSKLGRPLWFMNIGTESDKEKEVIVVITRQHPPEVSGHLAFDAFIDEMLKDNRRNRDFFKRYQLWVVPMINPDGVDLGHWRHNAGGIDLNRDWAYFRQPETRQVANFILERAKKQKANIILGLDFHSTQTDVYYTFPDSLQRKIPYFNHYWTQGIDESLPPYPSRFEPYAVNSPISKAWFLLQFGAESITFEIGDETDRGFIEQKGRSAAREMAKLLIMRDTSCK